MRLYLRSKTVAELMRLSPQQKRMVALWLRKEAREQEEPPFDPDPKEGTTVAETIAVLEAFRKLDKLARDILIKQVLKDEEAAVNGN